MTPLETAFPPIAAYLDTLTGPVRERVAALCRTVESVAPGAENLAPGPTVAPARPSATR